MPNLAKGLDLPITEKLGAQRNGILHIVLFLCVGALAACERQGGPQEFVFSGNTQGTTYTIKIVADSLSTDRETTLRQTIQARLDRIDKALSTYRPDSEISRFNQRSETTPFPVSKDFLEVVQMAANVSAVSGGAFDITVAPLVDAWGFGADKKPKRAPTEDELYAILERVGYAKIEVDPAASTLRKTRPDVICNVNAIAQGYTVDKLAADLEGQGIASYMVEVGGEVKARGQNARGISWQVGIEKPIASGRALAEVVALHGVALSTSGDYRNYYEEDGVRFSHTIDPKTGRPISHALASVSVIHMRCAVADAYATALMVLGPDKGYDFAVKRKLPALFIVHTGPDTFTEKATPEFTRRYTPGNAEPQLGNTP